MTENAQAAANLRTAFVGESATQHDAERYAAVEMIAEAGPMKWPRCWMIDQLRSAGTKDFLVRPLENSDEVDDGPDSHGFVEG